LRGAATRLGLAVAGLVLTASGLLATSSVLAARDGDETIEIVDGSELSAYGYSPRSVTIKVGDTVTWKNSGDEAHTVTSQDQLFDSRLLDPGKSYSYTFEAPGVYRYFCVPRPWMKGTVIVTRDDTTPRQSGNRGDSAAPTPDAR
jgi:plastocyanin